jgi:hypothetical protein
MDAWVLKSQSENLAYIEITLNWKNYNETD